MQQWIPNETLGGVYARHTWQGRSHNTYGWILSQRWIFAKIKEKKEVEKIETTTPGKSALLYDPGCFGLNFASFCRTKILKQEQEQEQEQQQQQQQEEPSELNRNGEQCHAGFFRKTACALSVVKWSSRSLGPDIFLPASGSS